MAESNRNAKPAKGKFRGWIDDNVNPILTVLSLAGVLFAAFFWLENHFAKLERLLQLERRVELKVTTDRLQAVQNRLWTLEDRIRTDHHDQTATEEVRKLMEEKDELRKKLEELQKSASI